LPPNPQRGNKRNNIRVKLNKLMIFTFGSFSFGEGWGED
jgi:hypothetical protein